LLGSIEADPPASRQWQELVKAADELLKTVTRTPTFSSELLAQLYRKRGFAYSRLRDYQRALAEFDRALELSPNYARAYASRGSVYRYLGVDQQAIDDASRAIDLKPRNAWAYAIRGHVYSLCQDYTQAIEDLSRAIEISSDYAYGNFLRGYISLWQGERERARADFAQNWQLNAKRVKVDWFIGWFSMNHKKPAEGDGTGSSRGILVIDLHRRGCSGSKTGLRMCWRC
jgi:tetratricopeptide (TPR) repeat protein